MTTSNVASFSMLLFAAGIALLCIKICEGATTKNPECQGLQSLADHFKAVTGTQIAKSSGLNNVNCQVFHNCSGIWCAGQLRGKNFNGTTYLEHCDKPIKILVHLKAPGSGVDEWKAFEDGQDVVFQLPTPFGNLPLTVTPSLKRNGNNIEIKFKACTKMPIIPNPVCNQIQETSVQVSRTTCPTQKPGNRTTTAKSMTSSAMKPRTTGKASIPSAATTERKLSTKKQTTGTVPTHSTIKLTTLLPTGKTHTVGHKKKNAALSHNSASHGLSTGGKVAIVVSVILVCLLTLGLIAYWRKLKRRGSPMYYNDIFVNRNSRSDLDDDEPLFESHLVL
eukprot:gene12926-14258_t